MIQGIERRKIFRNKNDREDFLDRVRELFTETQGKESSLLLGCERVGYVADRFGASVRNAAPRGWVRGRSARNRYPSFNCCDLQYLGIKSSDFNYLNDEYKMKYTAIV